MILGNIEEHDNWSKVLEIIENPNFIKQEEMELSDLADYISELLGSEYYDYGVGRICFEFEGGKLLKVATSQRGVEDNLKEKKLWDTVPTHLRQYFAKPFDFGHEWAVYEFIDGFIEYNAVDKYVEESALIIQELESNGIFLKDIGPKALYKNWRLRNGKLVIVDYAT